VREHRTFGSTRGPGCVDYPRGRIASERGLRTPVRESGGRFRQFAGRQSGVEPNHGSRRSVAENMRNLAIAIEDIDRHENQTQLDRRQVKIDHLDAISQVNTQPISRLQPTRQQQLRQPIAAPLEIAESVSIALEFKRNIVAAANQRRVKQFEESHANL